MMESLYKERVEKWVMALRSGQYQQGKHMLRSSKDLYCCLGVACDVYRLETGNGVWAMSSHDYAFKLGQVELTLQLPSTVAKWLGLSDSNPVLEPLAEGNLHYAAGTRVTRATELNDTGTNFNEIADRIEQTYLS